MSFAENEYDGNPQVIGCMFAYDGSDAKPFPVKGLLDGDTIVLLTSPAAGLGSGRKITIEDVIVTQGNEVDFELTVDADGDPLPDDMEIVAIQVYPHDGATPKVAVSTIWRMKIFSHSNRLIDQVVNINDRFDRPTTDDPSINNSRWDYVNEEGNTEIPCSMEIEGGATNATFTVKILFR